MKRIGPVGGRDSLGRILPLKGEKREDKLVGIFYFVHKGANKEIRPVTNVDKLLKEKPEVSLDYDHEAWQGNSICHWGKPLFGYYASSDDWVIRKHVEMLAYADIDFIVFDTTNRVTFKDHCMKVIAILDEYRQEGFKVPQVVYYTNTRSGDTIEEIYNDIYKANYCPDTWFIYEGKPLIIGIKEECSKETQDFFTFRKSQWPTENFKEGGFPWMSFEWPQHVFRDSEGCAQVMSVSVAQHPQIKFGDSAMYGETKNRGRSYFDGKNSDYENAVNWGYNFASQFEYAIKMDPKIIFITGFNEWTMGRYRGPEDRPVTFIDQANQEFSRDIEPMEGGHFDLYYMQLIDYVRRFKGVEKIEKVSRKTIDISKDFDQWDDISPSYYDLPFGNFHRDHYGIDGTRYINKTGLNDFNMIKLAYDEDRVYFYIDCKENIRSYSFTPWMRLFIRNPEDENIGWEGYQYAINLELVDSQTSLLHRSLGGFRYEVVKRIPMACGGKMMMIGIGRKDLGIDNKENFELHFKWADGIKGDWTIEDLYLNGDTAPYGPLFYVFRV